MGAVRASRPAGDALEILGHRREEGAHPLQKAQRIGHPGRRFYYLVVLFDSVYPVWLRFEARRGRKGWSTRPALLQG